MENIQKPLWKSQTVNSPLGGLRRSPGRPPKVAPLRLGGAAAAPPVAVGVRVQPLRGLHPVRALLREWLLELKVMGRSQRTIDWYQQKMDWYRRSGGVENLEELNAFELKRFLAEQQERGLSDNTIHGFFQVIKSFANWCAREEYPVDPSVVRMRPPKVALKEMTTYTAEQVQAIFDTAKVGWPQLAVKILLGTGIRVGELCNLLLEDVEDDEVLQLSAECRRRGLRTIVDVSDPERLLGQAQYDVLRHIIKDECDGFILHVTRDIVDSDCAWNVEVPAALEAFDNGGYDFIPFFRDISPGQTSVLEPHGRRLVSLAGVVVGSGAEGVSTGHIELANAALVSRLRLWAKNFPERSLGLAIRTRETGANDNAADLILDWSDDYKGILEGRSTEEPIARALRDLSRAVSSSGIRAVRISGPAHLSAGVALGFTFNRATGHPIQVAHGKDWWSADGDVTPSGLRIVKQQLNPGAPDLLLTIALSRPELVSAADRAIGSVGSPIGGRIVVQPELGASREAIESPAHSRGMVRDVTNALMVARAEWGTRGTIHLFLATPLAFAVLLGYSLNGFGALALYELRPGQQEYMRTLTLGGE